MTVQDDERELLQLTQALLDATLQRDRATLERIIADDFLMTMTRGTPDTLGRYADKAVVVERWSAPEDGVLEVRIDIDRQRVHISGDTAIVFGHVTDFWRDGEGEHRLETWVSDVWVKREGQ